MGKGGGKVILIHASQTTDWGTDSNSWVAVEWGESKAESVGGPRMRRLRRQSTDGQRTGTTDGRRTETT